MLEYFVAVSEERGFSLLTKNSHSVNSNRQFLIERRVTDGQSRSFIKSRASISSLLNCNLRYLVIQLVKDFSLLRLYLGSIDFARQSSFGKHSDNIPPLALSTTQYYEFNAARNSLILQINKLLHYLVDFDHFALIFR